LQADGFAVSILALGNTFRIERIAKNRSGAPGRNYGYQFHARFSNALYGPQPK
jgi:hypothetical protein